MKSQTIRKTTVATMLALVTASAYASSLPILGAFNIADGSLVDWGVAPGMSNVTPAPGTNTGSGGTVPFTGTTGPACGGSLGIVGGTAYACENTTGSFNGPSSGGQAYDTEFMGVATNANQTKLYFAIATGQRPDNGFSAYSPGDLFFKVNGFQWVIEMGGGVGGAAGALVQTQGAAGSTYFVNGSGSTVGHVNSNGAVTGTIEAGDTANAAAFTNFNTQQTVGSMWRTVQGYTPSLYGNQDPILPKDPTQFRAQTSANRLGMANVYSTRNDTNAYGNTRAIWEVEIDLSVFALLPGQFTISDAYWGPSCYNDMFIVAGTGISSSGGTTSGQGSTGSGVPEPTSLLLISLGLLGLGAVGRRKAA